MNSSFPNRWSFSYLKFTKYVIAEPKYKYGQQEQVTVRNHNRSNIVLNIFSNIYPLCCHGNRLNSAIWSQFIWIVEYYSRNIFVKKKKKICCETAKIANFHFFHYKSMETISCHSNQSSYPIGTKRKKKEKTNKKKKQYYSFPLPIDAMCEIWTTKYGLPIL